MYIIYVSYIVLFNSQDTITYVEYRFYGKVFYVFSIVQQMNLVLIDHSEFWKPIHWNQPNVLTNDLPCKNGGSNLA